MQWKHLLVLPLLVASIAPTVSKAFTVTTYPISGSGHSHADAYNDMVNNSLWITCRYKGPGSVVPGSAVYDPPLPGGIIVVRALGTCGIGSIVPRPDPPASRL